MYPRYEFTSMGLNQTRFLIDRLVYFMDNIQKFMELNIDLYHLLSKESHSYEI